MRASDYVLHRLSDEGIDTAWTLYGGAISELMDAFTRQKAMRYVVCQHEQACGYAAEGYAKAKGVPGFAIVTSGPGFHNIVTAIANCYYDSARLIVISGQVATNLIRPAGSALRQLGFQETPAVAIARPITKYAHCIRSTKEIVETLEDAIRIMNDGRPGPVLIDFPLDLQRAEI